MLRAVFSRLYVHVQHTLSLVLTIILVVKKIRLVKF